MNIQYHTFNPPSSLADYVRFYWVLEADLPAGETYTHRTMADGCAEMVFHYKGRFNEINNTGHTQSSFLAGIDGPSQTFNRYSINESFGIFGVYLYPYAIPVLFNLPAAVLGNQAVELLSLFGNEGIILQEKVLHANDNTHRLQIINEFLLARLKKSSVREQGIVTTIQHLIQTKGEKRVQELASHTCISSRQLERVFQQYAGFSPKLYSRIIRFQAVLKEYDAEPKSLTAIAYDCGYYDQSHFIHDFKEFSGHHPKAYFNGTAEGTEWRDS